jgi:hypothetical protein
VGMFAWRSATAGSPPSPPRSSPLPLVLFRDRSQSRLSAKPSISSSKHLAETVVPAKVLPQDIVHSTRLASPKTSFQVQAASGGTELHRRFAKVKFVEACDMEECLPSGWDALLEKPTLEQLVQRVGKKRVPVKSLLLDQGAYAGIGNWCADDVRPWHTSAV